MSPEPGSVFATSSRLVRLGLGGAVAEGARFVSWVHRDDFDAPPRLRVARGDLSGPGLLELAARALRTALEPAPRSRRAAPGRLLQAGFSFAYPDRPTAAGELVARARARTH